jgi:hypothetical protein
MKINPWRILPLQLMRYALPAFHLAFSFKQNFEAAGGVAREYVSARISPAMSPEPFKDI